MVGPDVGGVFAAGGTEATLTRVRNQLQVITLGALVHMATQRSGAACQDLADVVEHRRSDPPAIGGYEIPPVGRENGRKAVADDRSMSEHHFPEY